MSVLECISGSPSVRVFVTLVFLECFNLPRSGVVDLMRGKREKPMRKTGSQENAIDPEEEKSHIKTSPSELQRSRWVLDHCSGNSSRRDRDSWRAMSRTFSVFPPSFGHRSSPTGTGDCCCSGEEAVGDCALTGPLANAPVVIRSPIPEYMT